jgi:hypothetical protein
MAAFANLVASNSDWKVGVPRDFGMLTGAMAMIGTNAGKAANTSPENAKFLGKSALVPTVSKTL